jgi:hypothetical protein
LVRPVDLLSVPLSRTKGSRGLTLSYDLGASCRLDANFPAQWQLARSGGSG